MILSILPDLIPEIDAEIQKRGVNALYASHADRENPYHAALEMLASDADEAKGEIAVMPLFGVVTQHPTSSWFASTMSTDLFGQAFDRVVQSSKYRAVVINMHSPGGQVWGTQELGDKIFAARGQKPVVVVANSMSASAAYWIGSQASNFVVTPGGEVGAIGVYTVRYEEVENDDGTMGGAVGKYRRKVYATPTKKGEVAGVLPTSPETDAEIKAEVDEYYSRFVDAVARGRGKSKADVRDNFGGGGMKLAKAAAEAGMVDRIATLDEVIRDLRTPRRARKYSAEANDRLLALEKNA